MADSEATFGLRPAQKADARLIKHMVRRAGINPLGLHWSRFTVAVDGRGQVVGCVQIKPHGTHVRELASLVVARPWRRKGVGTALVEEVKARSGGDLWLMCRNDLAPYYARFGFEIVADSPSLDPAFRRYWQLGRLLGVLTRGKAGLAFMRWQTQSIPTQGE